MKILLLFFLSSAFAYSGSSFDEVWNQVTSDPYRKLPQYQVTLGSFFSKGKDLLTKSAKRTLKSEEDILPRFDKLLHPNGSCMKGRWIITEDTPYTGLLSKGTDALILLRASTTLTNTKRGRIRGFGLSGKIFPTLNPDEKVKTANFFTIDNLVGTYEKHFTDAKLTNEPQLVPSFSFDIIGLIGLGAHVAKALGSADKNAGFRDLYALAKEENKKAIYPKWIQITAERGQKKSNKKDFRRELEDFLDKNRIVRFKISVADPKNGGKSNWKRIGTIEVDDFVSSFSCDKRLHFHHSPLK